MLFSIVIVTYNGQNHLQRCLSSVFNNLESSYEVIVVDNHSSDHTVIDIKKSFRKFKNKLTILELDNNYGPAYARNRGVAVAKGQLLAFLDNDTEVDKNWLITTKNTFLKNPKVGCIQAKLLLLSDKKKFDYAGDYLNQYGLLTHRATYGDQDFGQFNKQTTIFAAKSAGMFIRKKVFDQIGGFDEDYFIYMEETDLCWRSWLAGYECLYLPTSIVYHEFSGSFKFLNHNLANFNLHFHGTKNYLLTNLKNLSTSNIFIIFPRLVFIYFGYSLYFLFRIQLKPFIYTILGIFWNLSNIINTLKKRRIIQSTRKLTDKQLFPLIFKKTSFIKKIKQSLIFSNK
jgi:GT2 family glycosyltransferase